MGGPKSGTTSASCVSASSESRLPSDELALVTEEQGPPNFLSLGGDSPETVRRPSHQSAPSLTGLVYNLPSLAEQQGVRAYCTSV